MLRNFVSGNTSSECSKHGKTGSKSAGSAFSRLKVDPVSQTSLSENASGKSQNPTTLQTEKANPTNPRGTNHALENNLLSALQSGILQDLAEQKTAIENKLAADSTPQTLAPQDFTFPTLI